MISVLNRKRIIYAFLIIWILSVNIWIYYYKQEASITSFEDKLNDDSNVFDTPKQSGEEVKSEEIINNLLVQLYQIQFGVKDLKKVKSHSTNYDEIFKNHEINGLLKKLNFQQRCDLYFNNLYIKDINWKLNPNKDFFLESRHSFEFESFRKEKTNQVKETIAKEKNIAKDDVKLDGEFENKIKNLYKEFWLKTMDSEQGMMDYVTHLKIFNKCYVTGDNTPQMVKTDKFIKNQQNFIDTTTTLQKFIKPFQYSSNELKSNLDSFTSCLDLERRLYPWLSFSYPVYQRWNGETLYSPPNMKKYIKHQEPFQPTNNDAHNGKGGSKFPNSKLTNNKNCFLNQFKNKMNSKGIVLSIGDAHVEDTVNFIHLLRALNNHYPIEIVYYDSLSEESKAKLVHAAQDQFSALPQLFNKVSQFFPDDYLDENDGGLPKQELWFVNAYSVIHDDFKHKFKGFSNKFIATMFNSFEEFILVDADTIPVQNMNFFFNLKGYKSKGAYFFKDRSAPEFRPLSDATFFKKLTPSIIDNLMFDIPLLTDHTFNLDFFQGMGHLMESGLVAIDRNLHFNSILMMIQLNFFKPVLQRVYGDKEIFWLGFAINGDEGYTFNKYYAASIGEETPTNDRLKPDGNPSISREVCGAHPGHINGEDGKSLAWFNSGFKFCGQYDKTDFKADFDKKQHLKHLKSIEEMKIFYQNPLVLKNAVIPPFKNKLETYCDNIVNEPNRGWVMQSYCNQYLWCAYSSIGGATREGTDNTQVGQFIEFDKRSTDLFAYYGDIWVGNE